MASMTSAAKAPATMKPRDTTDRQRPIIAWSASVAACSCHTHESLANTVVRARTDVRVKPTLRKQMLSPALTLAFRLHHTQPLNPTTKLDGSASA
jgi:hypothetical protein